MEYSICYTECINKLGSDEMSLTIRCDKCGNEMKFNNGDSRNGDKIQLIPDIRSVGWEGWEVDGVDIYCENPKCNHDISIN